MAGSRELKIVILGDATSAQKALGQVDGATAKSEGRWAKYGAAIKAAAVAGGIALVAFATSSVGAFQESEASQAKLAAAFQKFPALANSNLAALQRLNSELAKKTRFDDDATASGQAVLASFDLTGKQIEQLTPLLQDYAARTGKDLPTAATDLGKAMLGQGRALKAIGVDFTDTGSAAGNYAVITDALSKKVGGFAEKEGATTSGRLAILQNQFGELQEKVGGALIPALLKLTDVLLAIISFIDNLNPAVLATVAAVASFAAGVFIVVKAIQAWTAVQAALNVVMSLNPFVLVAAAIAALVAGIVIAYNSSATFRNVVQTAFSAVATAAVFMKDAAIGAIRFLVDTWLASVEWIVKGAATAFGWVPGIGGKMKAAARDVEQFRDDVNAALGGIRDKVIQIKVGPVGSFGNPGVGAGLAGRAAGGPVTAGRPYIVGEHRPEVFVPDRNGTILPRVPATGGSTVVHVHVAGSVVTERELGELVLREIRTYSQRNGSAAIA